MSVYLMYIRRLKERLLTSKISAKFLFIIMGIASTAWFLIRVIPKPQRAGYPCMRTAAPIMSGFVLYMLSLGGLTILFKKTVTNLKRARYLSATFAFVLAMVFLVTFNVKDIEKTYASPNAVAWTKGILPDAPNTPMGEGKGINPGRVVWAYNPAATNENCPNTISDAYFMASNNNQDTINKMANEAIKSLANKSTVSEAWDAIFKNFNEKKTGSATGYTSDQTIFIKVNNGQAGWAINMSTLAETGQTSAVLGTPNIAMSNTSPAAVISIIRQLVDDCGVSQNKIYVAEPMTHVYKSMYDAIHELFPNVIILDKENHTSLGRTTTSGWHANAINYSDKGDAMPDAITDAMMNEMYDADYLINIPALKAHARGGVTLTAKNHFGTHGNHPGYGYGSFHLHEGLISTQGNDIMNNGLRGNYKMYRVLTDLMGHEKLGGNTVLFVMDGLWSGIEATDMPVKWNSAPFNNDFPSSLFISQDAVALESVCIDFLRAEAEVNSSFMNRPFFPAVDDHIHQAADKANWPTDFTYDPEDDGTAMSSLGVHEHWNNSTDKQYTRNLFTSGTGIDLMSIPESLVDHDATVANSLTVTITTGGSPLQDAIITINGSNYITNSEGKVIIGNLENQSGLNYSITKTGFVTLTGQVDISGDTQLSKVMEASAINAVNTVTLNNNFSVYPNPCTTEATLSYTLETSARVTISLISLDGRTIDNNKDEMLSAGEYSDVINTSNLKSGLYICVIKISSGNITNSSSIKLTVK